MTSHQRDLTKKLAALGISLLLSFLLLEAYVRLTYTAQWNIPRSAVREPGIFSARMRPDHDADITLLDGATFHVRTNARGFRGPLVSSIANKPLRVISLGDSFTFGWGIPLDPLLDALSAHDEKQDLYFPKDRHLTARGYAVAAEALGAKLGPVLDRLWDERRRARLATAPN